MFSDTLALKNGKLQCTNRCIQSPLPSWLFAKMWKIAAKQKRRWKLVDMLTLENWFHLFGEFEDKCHENYSSLCCNRFWYYESSRTISLQLFLLSLVEIWVTLGSCGSHWSYTKLGGILMCNLWQVKTKNIFSLRPTWTWVD